MGQIIGIWAPCPGTGRTTVTLAFAYKMAELLDKGKKILVCCANGSNGTLNKTMGISSEEVGIEDLVSYKLAGFASDKYEAMLVRQGRIYFAGSSKMTAVFCKTYISQFIDIFNDFREKFDITIIDLASGYENLLGNTLLPRCDKVVTVFDQGKIFSQSSLLTTLRYNILILNKCKKMLPEEPDLWDGLGGLSLKHDDIFKITQCDLLPIMVKKGRLFQYFTLKTDFNTKIESIISDILQLNTNSFYVQRTVNENSRKIFNRMKMNILGGQQG